MPTPVVIDLSHHNVVPQSFAAAQEAGIVGVIHKLTEGSGYVDDKVSARRHLAKEAGLLWGLYHFIRPGNAEAQAEFMFSKAKDLYDDETIWVLDWEDKGVSTGNALAFLRRIEALTGRIPVLYSGHVVKEAQSAQFNEEITAYPLWLCHYTTGTPSLPKGFDHYWLWQYTDEGTCPGITPPTDLNAISISLEQFVFEWSGEDDEDGPVDPDAPKIVSVIITTPPGVKVEVQVVEMDEDD